MKTTCMLFKYKKKCTIHTIPLNGIWKSFSIQVINIKDVDWIKARQAKINKSILFYRTIRLCQIF